MPRAHGIATYHQRPDVPIRAATASDESLFGQLAYFIGLTRMRPLSIVRKIRVVPILLFLLLIPAGASAQVFTETTDVGSTLADSSDIALEPVRVIPGSLSSGTYVDLFARQTTRPLTLPARVVGGGLIDSSLFILDAESDPVYLNDDAKSELTLRSELTAGNFPTPLSFGLYHLGISAGGYEPINVLRPRLSAPFIFSLTERRGWI